MLSIKCWSTTSYTRNVTTCWGSRVVLWPLSATLASACCISFLFFFSSLSWGKTWKKAGVKIEQQPPDFTSTRKNQNQNLTLDHKTQHPPVGGSALSNLILPALLLLLIPARGSFCCFPNPAHSCLQFIPFLPHFYRKQLCLPPSLSALFDNVLVFIYFRVFLSWASSQPSSSGTVKSIKMTFLTWSDRAGRGLKTAVCSADRVWEVEQTRMGKTSQK